MRKWRILVVPLALFATILPGAWYFSSHRNEDELNDTLRSLGYLPITPPSNLLNLGSLYYVDSDVKFFKTLCAVEREDLKDAVVESPSTSTLADELHSGNYSIGIRLNLETVGLGRGSHSPGLGSGLGTGHGKFADKYLTKVHYSLSDVHLYEIALGNNHKIYRKLMAQEDCNRAVLDYINAGGYVCQGQQILEATVEYDLRLHDGRTIGAGAETDAGAVAKALKVATHVDSSAELNERSGRLVTGTALKYGIAMNPTCLTPLHGRFQRVLPRSTFDRVMNFVKFRLIEPILPGT